MRLVYAVLLSGIGVFVSKVNLLQAHALLDDVADDLASGLRDTDAKATADNESRMSGDAADSMEKVWELLVQDWTTTLNTVSTQCKSTVLASEEAINDLKGQLASHFTNARKFWKFHFVNEVDFQESAVYQRFSDFVGDINRHLHRDQHIQVNNLGERVMD